LVTLNYEPEVYWERRLAADFSLRGTGHVGFSPGYNDWVYRRKTEVLARALAPASAGSRALDIGSGVGWVVGQLLKHGLRVEGCDITDVAVRGLSETYRGTAFFKAAVGSAPIPREPGTYDVVTMLDVAYHITDDSIWAAAVADIGRVLAPNGLLIITDRLGDRPARVSEHVQFRSREDWERAGRGGSMRFSKIGGLYTWLGRPADTRGWRLLPDAVRGPVEYLRDARIRHSAPHLRWAVLRKDSSIAHG
jgi:SAM-dependent methyltransferase